MQKPPQGIWFEERRKRYRVRLYVGPIVVYRSYHKDLKTAMEAYALAKLRQASTIIPEQTIDESLSVESLIAQLAMT